MTKVKLTAVQVPSLPSIDDVTPAEQGGPVARQGFSYQDEIAVGFVLDMLDNAALTKIHFETHDDLILVWIPESGATLTAEFVQVKGGEPDKLWSVADICQREKKKVGTSIFETSLGRDRHKESSAFRMVTLRSVVSDLSPLTFPMGSEGRTPACSAMTALRSDFETRFPGLQSIKNNDCGYWLENCRWDVRHDQESVRGANTMRLFAMTQKIGQPLLIEQLNILLDGLRIRVKTAGDAKWMPDPARKILTRTDILEWWKDRLEKLAQGASRASGGKLAEKMKDAALPNSLIAMAIELRLEYAAKVRTPRYMEPETSQNLQSRVKSAVQSLSAKLVGGSLKSDGPKFHQLCVERMDQINDALQNSVDDQSAFLKGCMYDIADRCLLRFNRDAP